MDGYLRVSSRLKLGPVGEDCLVKTSSSAGQPQPAAGETGSIGPARSCIVLLSLQRCFYFPMLRETYRFY